jgi:CubicO group peptidase (beta-lactamase class C family)
MTVLKPEVDAAEVGLDRARLERLDRHFARYVDDGRLPGWLITVSRYGRLAHVSRCGSRDIEAGLEVEPDTLWRIYSMTKPVTSVAAMMLYEEGALELTDPVSAFIPSFAHARVHTGGPDVRPVTGSGHGAGAGLASADPHGGPDLRVPPGASGGCHVPGRRVRMGDASRVGPGTGL